MPTMRVPSAPRTGRHTSSVPRQATASTSSSTSAFQPTPSDPTIAATLRGWPHGHARAGQHGAQIQGVADREALPVVVEVRPHGRLARDLAELRRPRAQLALRVVAAPPAVAVVEAHERPVGG